MDAHTKLPWKVIKCEQKEYRCIAFSAKRDEPYTTSPLEPADAEFIVRACNSHYELLAACQRLLRQVELTDDYHASTWGTLNDAAKQAREAIAKARGEMAIVGGSIAPASSLAEIERAVREQTPVGRRER